MLLTNPAGLYIFLSYDEFDDLIHFKLDIENDTTKNLISRHFITISDLDTEIMFLSTQLRTRKSFLRNFTVLHMIVLTCYCSCDCDYCQVKSIDVSEKKNMQMNMATAKRVVEMIFQTPSTSITIELQGGEPTLNWSIVEFIVEYSKSVNTFLKKKVTHVLCTNLNSINKKMIGFIKKHQISISTSLDGPKGIHDLQRKCRDKGSSYDRFISSVAQLRQNGIINISPLLTITKNNIHQLKQIIDEYVKLGYKGIFLRPLNPFGNAKLNHQKLSYNVDDYIECYLEAVEYIFEINKSGIYFEEYYLTLLLTRILTPFSTGFVDLQSPAGSGISGVIYDYDGSVYSSDEGRMLAREGDKIFYMGSVYQDKYHEIFHSPLLIDIVKKSILEIMPGCSWCVYNPYCGSDPVKYYVESGDISGFRPYSDFCKKHFKIFEFIFKYLKESDKDIINIFWSWVTKRDIKRFSL